MRSAVTGAELEHALFERSQIERSQNQEALLYFSIYRAIASRTPVVIELDSKLELQSQLNDAVAVRCC